MKLEIIYFNAGGGHAAAAKALSTVIKRDYPWEVIMTNLFDIIDAKKLFQKITNRNHEDIYNKVLSSGFTIGLGPQLKVLQAIIRAAQTPMANKLREHWSETQPDLVVSVIPNFNAVIGESLSAPFVTIITDMADYPPHFWVEPAAANQHIICGTEYARAQAIVAGVSPNRIYSASGMILRPEFYAHRVFTYPEEPVGLVMFGGIGSKKMVSISKKLADRQLILVCGKNEELRQKLLKLANSRHEVVGFVEDMPALMARSSYFIGKPGPGSISEAVHMGLPVIVTLNAFTMPQERWNCRWVLDNEVGLVLKSFKHIDAAVYELLGSLDRYRKNTQLLENTAIYEIPGILDDGFMRR